jgi:SynChlorMet cassette protein ScmC
MKLALSEFYASLNLADGNRWMIVADDHEAARIVWRLADVMQLSSVNGGDRKLLVSVRDKKEYAQKRASYQQSIQRFFGRALEDNLWDGNDSSFVRPIVFGLDPAENGTEEVLQLIHISSLIAFDVVFHSGMLLHGALIARDGKGVILAGPGGVGKTTACRRLPHPWQVLCDDTTLVVQDDEGRYWAHPWPTWSKFLYNGMGGSWDVERSLPLQAIFFLVQSSEPDLSLLGKGEAVCYGIESVEQASQIATRVIDLEWLRIIRRKQFNNFCQLAQMIETYQLSLNLTYSFWSLIEDVLFCELTEAQAGIGSNYV